MTTAVPSIQITSTGVVVPSEQDILAGVWADINAAFGGDLNMQLSTPQGQLAQSMTAIIGDAYSQIALLINQLDPDNASGSFQDAIGRIYYIDRVRSTGTLVLATVYGLVGAVIPAGALAQDLNGVQYTLTAAVEIGLPGSASASFQATTHGPIACPAGTLTKIITAVNGWESVTNTVDGTVGGNEESRNAFELRRQASVAGNAHSSTAAIAAAVWSVSDVIDVLVIDNPTGSPISYGSSSYSIVAHSVCVSVAGGDSTAIAEAIWSKKPVGCGYTGNTTVDVTDTSSLLTSQPVYPVTFLIPAAKPVYFLVQLVNDTRLPSNIVDLVKSAILDAFTGADGGQRARIGGQIYSGRFYAAVAGASQFTQISSIGMGWSSGAATQQSLSFGIDELPAITGGNITVALI